MTARDFIRIQNLQHRRDGQRRAGRLRRLKSERRSRVYASEPLAFRRLRNARNLVAVRIYSRRYSEPATVVAIRGQLGIETPQSVEDYLAYASDLIDTRSRKLTIDLADCDRVWPSGVTLLCSLAKWVELCSLGDRKPSIGSTPSRSARVNSYLTHCGFNTFVRLGAPGDSNPNLFERSAVVPIQRETSRQRVESREDEIVSLLEEHSTLTADQISLFNCKVLTEAFNNVTEHGVPIRDEGWWVLAQYHREHRLISLCIADNGIGIRNTLTTGPQADQIRQRLAADAGDGDYIRLALSEPVSGALDAPQTERRFAGLMPDRYARGAHRGNGMKRILDTCRMLKIRLSVLSHHGYVVADAYSNALQHRSFNRRVFGGTMLHFSIPGRENTNGLGQSRH